MTRSVRASLTPPPRLHVLLARAAPAALVIRRGPADFCTLFAWDRRSDRFTQGDRLRARLYPLRSDLSPDGRHLLYFALDGKSFSDTQGSWTGISVAPTLRASALYANGSTYGGGGLFKSAGEYWLDDASGWPHETKAEMPTLIRRPSPPWRDAAIEETCRAIYPYRLLRDGWTLARPGPPDGMLHFEKAVGPHWVLRQAFRAGGNAGVSVESGPGRNLHELFNARTGQTLPCPDWEWADLDGDRLVWAAQGRLCTGQPDARGDGFEERVLHDFNP